MNHAIWLTNPEALDLPGMVELGVAAEGAGWDGVFVSDSLPFAVYPDPWVVLSGIAARTEAITLGTWVVPLPRRDPWQVASEVAALDRLSGGRVLFGAGLGNDVDYEAYGREYDPPALAGRLDEALEVVTGLWDDEPLDYDGEHFQLEDAEVVPGPAQDPRVPILAGCWWPNKAPFRRGARWDGVMPFWPALTGEGTGPHGEETGGSPMEELEELMAFYRDVADDPGEVVLPTVPGEDRAEYAEHCEALGATWVLETDAGDDATELRATVEDGPPG